MDIQFGKLDQLYLLLLVALGLVAAVFAIISRRRALKRFATSNLIGQIVPGGVFKRLLSAALVAGSLLALVLALIDIRWGKVWREVPQTGIEVMFVLDVSRSMLAEDVSPNRLGRAKQQIKDLVDEMTGDRVGLVVFAGDVRQQIPLTSHYQDFKQSLDEVGTHNVKRGGTQLGDAIRAAANSFLTKTNDHKAIIVFTDGEDQASDPVKAAQQAFAEHGIRVFTVGLGDMDQGARIPIRDNRRGETFLQYEGQQVWSKLNGRVLQQIAMETNGAYIPAGTKQVNMADVYHGYVANIEQKEFETARINSYVARFQWFLAIALILLLLEIILSTWPTRQRRQLVRAALEPVRVAAHQPKQSSSQVTHKSAA